MLTSGPISRQHEDDEDTDVKFNAFFCPSRYGCSYFICYRRIVQSEKKFSFEMAFLVAVGEHTLENELKYFPFHLTVFSPKTCM